MITPLSPLCGVGKGLLLHAPYGEAVAATGGVAGVDGAIEVEEQVAAVRGRVRTRRARTTEDARGVERAITGFTITGSREEDHVRRYARLIAA